MKKILALVLSLSVLSMGLVACGTKTAGEGDAGTAENGSDQLVMTQDQLEVTTLGGTGVQFEAPKDGETVAEIKVKDFGSIYVRFFEEEAPKAVENFVTHAKNGYYDNLTFHRVMNEFMIQGGDPTGTGAGGESIWGEAFEDEYSDHLFPYRGSLCMANAGPSTNGSQFFLVQAGGLTDEMVDYFQTEYNIEFTDESKQNYSAVGGTPWLENQHTVFGQIISGYDVLDKIAATEVDEATSKPKTDAIIETIQIYQFQLQK